MARRRTSRELSVFAQRRRVGTLKSSGSGESEFRYAPGWLAYSEAFPMSLSLPLTEKAYKSGELLPFLDNLLPDEEATRRAIAARVGARGTDPFSLLWELGRDCVGALRFLPIDEEPDWDARSEGETLTDVQIEALLTSLRTAPLGLSRGTEFRLSVAGVQEKTALLRRGDTWLLPRGTTPSSHIIKPAIGMRSGVDLSDSVENEYVCMLLAAEVGIPTANVSMARFGAVKALVVERFDRVWRGEEFDRLPQEDLCQALAVPSFRKYDADGGPGMLDVLRLLLQSDAPQEDRRLFLQSCLLFWILGASDGHAKNFSLALGPQGRFRLTPLYDVTSLQPNVDARHVTRREFRVAMAVGQNRHHKVEEILPRHFVQTATEAGVDRDTAHAWIDDVAETVPAAIERVGHVVGDAVTAELYGSIASGALRRVELLA